MRCAKHQVFFSNEKHPVICHPEKLLLYLLVDRLSNQQSQVFYCPKMRLVQSEAFNPKDVWAQDMFFGHYEAAKKFFRLHTPIGIVISQEHMVVWCYLVVNVS